VVYIRVCVRPEARENARSACQIRVSRFSVVGIAVAKIRAFFGSGTVATEEIETFLTCVPTNGV
jgi:hypothetical protein